MNKETEATVSEANTYRSSKAEARKFIQNVQRLTEIAQARLTGTLEGGVAMWEMLNAEVPQKQ